MAKGELREEDGTCHVVGSTELIKLGSKVFKSEVVAEWRLWCAASISLDKLFGGKLEGGVEVLGITIRPPSAGSDDFMLVVRAVRKSARIVAFHRGRSALDIVDAFYGRLLKGTVDWRDDRPQAAQDSSPDDGGREPLRAVPEV